MDRRPADDEVELPTIQQRLSDVPLHKLSVSWAPNGIQRAVNVCAHVPEPGRIRRDRQAPQDVPKPTGSVVDHNVLILRFLPNPIEEFLPGQLPRRHRLRSLWVLLNEVLEIELFAPLLRVVL